MGSNPVGGAMKQNLAKARFASWHSQVLYFRDIFICSKRDALRREGYFKTTAGKKALRLMLRDALAERSAYTEAAGLP